MRSERLLLRAPRAADKKDRLACGRDPELVRMYGGDSRQVGPLTARAVDSWYQAVCGDGLRWIIEAAGRCIGDARLHAVDERNRSARYAIGIFDPAFWGKGLGTEATRLVLPHAFEDLGLHRVEARVLSYNRRAIRCYEKCGFVREGLLRDSVLVADEWHSDLVMSMLEADYRKMAGPRQAQATGSTEQTLRERVTNLQDFERLARAAMKPAAFEHYSRGAGDETTLRENVAAFARHRLRPRVMAPVTDVDCSTAMMGTKVSMPLALAPTGLNHLAHPDGELAVARAAAKSGVVYCVSVGSSYPLEDIAAEAKGQLWFQTTHHRDPEVTRGFLQGAAAAGYEAVVLTVDVPAVARREVNLKNAFRFPRLQRGNYASLLSHTSDAEALRNRIGVAPFTRQDIGWIREAAGGLPLVLKGILRREDAHLAVEHGVQGVIVSNHGGRQLVAPPAALDVLEEVAETVKGQAEIYVDGGVRRGVDVVTTLALGARAAFIGRPYLYALATAGETGVEHCLSIIRDEIENGMALLGVESVRDIDRRYVA